MVKTGSSAVIGSWKIIAMRLPRMRRISRQRQLEQVLAAKEDASAGDLPGRVGIRRRIESAVTDLPQPDSPTSPNTSSS